MMRLTREKIRKIIIEVVGDTSPTTGAPVASVGSGVGDKPEDEEKQLADVKNVLMALQKVPDLEVKLKKINNKAEFTGLFTEFVNMSSENIKPQDIKAALLVLANSITM